MFKERMQAVMLQDREKLRRVFQEYDVEHRGQLNLSQLHDAICKLCPGMKITKETSAVLMKRFSNEPGFILFQDFLQNFLGLPPDFFSMKFSMSEGEKKLQQKEDDNRIKEFKYGTPISKVQTMFVNRMRRRLLNVKAAMYVALKRPNDMVTHMSENDLWYLMRDQGMMISKKELHEIMEHFDQNRDGKIHYEELAHELLGLPKPASVRHIAPFHANRPPLSPQAQNLVQSLAIKCERAAAAPQRLHNMFKAFDKDGSGSIAYDEFKSMVTEFGCEMEGADAAASLLQKFDKQGTGALSYSQFIEDVLGLKPRTIEGAGPDARCSTPEIVQAVASNVKQKVFTDKAVIAKNFEAFDRDHGGSLSFPEFLEGLKTLGLPITKPQAKKLFSEFEVDENGEVSTDAFAAAVLGVQRAQAPESQQPPKTSSGLPPRSSSVMDRATASKMGHIHRNSRPPTGASTTFPPLSTSRNGRSIEGHSTLLPVPGASGGLARARRTTQGGGPRMPAEFLPSRSKSVNSGGVPEGFDAIRPARKGDTQHSLKRYTMIHA